MARYQAPNSSEMSQVVIGTKTYKVPVVLTASATVDMADTADGAGVTTSITVPGAALGDFVLASFGVDLVDTTVTAYVQAADTVEVRFQNESGSSVNLASTTMRVMVFKQA